MGDVIEHEKNGVARYPLTLSGVDVTDIAINGKKLELRGDRVALVADANGRLQRQIPSDTTHIRLALVFKELAGKRRDQDHHPRR